MDPSRSEMEGFKSIGDIMVWVGMPPDQPTGKSFLTHLGAQDSMHQRLIAIQPVDVYDSIVQAWRVPGEADATVVPSTMMDSMAKMIGRIARLGCGMQLESSSADVLKLMEGKLEVQQKAMNDLRSAVAGSSAAQRKVKLSTILSQINETEVETMSETDIQAGYARYEVIFGEGVRPPPDSECTDDQLSGIKYLLHASMSPYVDFAIWGPHGHRILRKIKLSGATFKPDGSISNIELFGPADFDMWMACYRLLEVALIMLDAVDLGKLQQYRDMMTRYHQRYGNSVWHLLYQADVRTRLEHMDRVRRNATIEHAAAKLGGKDTAFEEKRPWNFVWGAVCADTQWWKNELEDPALLVLAKAARLGEVVAGDARANGAPQVSHSPAHPQQLQQRSGRGQQSVSSNSDRSRSRMGAREHNVKDGKYVTNRQGSKMCEGFQSGSCTETAYGMWCAKNTSEVHQCNICLGNHRGNQCTNTSIPDTGASRGKSGGGKGKGAGKRKGGKSHH